MFYSKCDCSLGAKPVFVDVDRKTNNIDPKLIKKKITDKTKAIMVVHLFGLCADMAEIRRVLPDHIKIIEDAACASGAEYLGDPAGGLGDIAAFSLHQENQSLQVRGGMVTTNDIIIAEKLDQLRNHGSKISEEQRHKVQNHIFCRF